MLENIKGCKSNEVSPAFINAVLANQRIPASKISPQKQKYIEDTICLTVPDEFRKKWMEFSLINQDMVSLNKLDLRQTDMLLH